MLMEVWQKVLAGNEQLWSGIIGAIVGAIAAMIAGLIAAWTTLRAARATAEHANELSAERARQDKQFEVAAVIQAIRSELDVLWHLAETQIAPAIKQIGPSKPLNTRFEVRSAGVFPVYESNAALLGSISDYNVRDSIVRAYAFARSFIDIIMMNNRLVEEHEEALIHHNGHLANIRQNALETFSAGVVGAYQNLGEQYDDVMKRTAGWLLERGIEVKPPTRRISPAVIA